MPVHGWLGAVVGAVTDKLGDGFSFLSDTLAGLVDVSEWGKVFDIFQELGDLKKSALDIAKAAAVVAAVLAVSQIIIAIQAGLLAKIIASEVGRKVGGLVSSIRTLNDFARKEYDRARGLLDNAKILTTIQTLQRIHRVALVISPLYRREIEEINKGIADISKEVFGDVQVIRATIVITDMLTHDISTLLGHPVSLAETRAFRKSLSVTQTVERNSRRYARRPDLFWTDLDAGILQPLYAERDRLRKTRDGRIGSALGSLTRIEGIAQSAGDRFDEYIRELTPLIQPDDLRELHTMRREYRSRVLIPIGQLNSTIAIMFPAIEGRLDSVFERAENNTERLGEIEPMIANPKDNTEAQRGAQRERINSIWDLVAQPVDSAPLDLRTAFQIVDAVYNDIQAGS